MEDFKGFSIKPLTETIGYEVEYIGRGSLHLSLRGIFTSRVEARKAITTYVERKEELDGEIDQRSRDQQIQRRPYHRRKSANND